MRTSCRFVLLLAVSLAYGNCFAGEAENSISWEPVFPPQAFPELILARGGTSRKVESPVLCDPQSMFRVPVKSPTPATRIHVEVKVDGFFLDTSSCDAILEHANEEYLVAPTPRWDFHKLAYNDEPYPATIAVSLSANDAPLGQKTTR